MKKLIALLSLTLATVTSHAAANDAAYSLNTFNIGQGSYVLPDSNSITSGTIEIDRTNKQLKLTLQRRFFCPAGAMCAMVMPAPVEITLPVVYIGSGFCGGVIVNAERNLMRVDGGRVQIEIVDDNGNICEHPDKTTVKAVHVTVTEQAARSNKTVVSEMTGFPIAR
jgi:hypothetical protein